MISKNPLVSIITPCLNGEKYVHRFLDSILRQTYDNIELIFVNDGSTDKTEEIVLSYDKKFKDKGVVFKYIYQDNKGLAGAINAGLKHFSGAYLCWPDSDDYLEDESIENRVAILEKYTDYAAVTSDAYIRHIDDLNKPIGLISTTATNNFSENQFELLLKGESIFCNGCHMLRANRFLEAYPERKIFEARRGQNWQMLLPVYYKYKRYFLNEPLYNYIIYHTSMSRGDDTEDKKLFRCSEHEDILINTISSIDMSEEEKINYIQLIEDNYTRRRLYIAFDHKNQQLLETQYNLLRKRNKLAMSDKIKYKIGKYRILSALLHPAIKQKRKWSSVKGDRL